MLIYFVSAKILSLHQKSNHIFSRIIIIGIFFPNTTTPLRRLHITTPTTAPNARTFFNPYFPLKSLIKLDLPENSVQTEQEALPESSRYSQFMYRHPFQSTSEKGLTCRLPTEEANSLKQIDRNLAQILPKSHNLFFEKKKKEQRKNRKKIHRKAYLYNPYYNQFINIYLMQIRLVSTGKKRFLPLLLLADEQESMIDRYLERGDLYVMYDKLFTEPVAVAVVTDEGKGIRELKNLAVAPHWQRKGYGRQMVEYLCQRYQNVCHTLTVGTGDSRMTISFYQSCGFVYSHMVPDFFTLHYDHPIVEDGKVLKDMYYFSRTLTQTNETDG